MYHKKTLNKKKTFYSYKKVGHGKAILLTPTTVVKF